MLPLIDLNHVLNLTDSLWTEFRGKRVFISGGTGFVGSWLVESFLHANKTLSLGAELVVLSRDPKAFLEKRSHLKSETSLSFVQGDVRSFADPSGPLHFVIHAAMDPSSATSSDLALETMDVSYSGTKRVLELCQQKKVQKYLFVSSGAVYGKQPPSLSHLDENYGGAPDLNKRSSSYGEGKRLGEWFSHVYGEISGFEIKIARCFAFVGPYLPLDSHFAVGNFIRQAMAGENILIKGDGQAQRSYMYASDMTIWLWHILVNGKNNTAYNVGSEKALSIRELAQKIISIENPKLNLEIQGKSAKEISGDRYIPSTKKSQLDLGLKISVDDDEALRKTIDFYRKMAETK